MKLTTIVSTILLLLTCVNTSRILICVPCPSVSHQIVFYPLITELLKRKHEVIFITTDPMYPKGNGPAILTEIDTHDITYKAWRQKVLGSTTGKKEDAYEQARNIITTIGESFVLQMETQEVQDLIKKKTHIDLVIVEGVSKSAQVLSHVFKAPIILMNSLGAIQNNNFVMGAPIYPKLLYPIFWHQKLHDMTVLDKIRVLWDTYKIEKIYDDFYIQENFNVKRLFGSDTPSLEDLGNNVDMLFLNSYPIWDNNRPVPPGVLFIAGIHQTLPKKLPEDLKAYLDSSKRGVVYCSFGTNVNPSKLSQEKVKALINGLAKLNFDVLLKWDFENLPGKGNNTKVAKWLPQGDLLRHPNIKAFVTQGGLQSFDEALTAGVPLVGIPMIADQWYNVDRYASLEIGIALLMEELTEDILANAVNTVIDDPSYKRNIIELREKIRDQPESGLQRAVWWTEYVIRHKGAKHLRAPAANMPWPQYIDVELLAVLALIALTLLSTVAVSFYILIRNVKKILHSYVKIKSA